MVEQAAISYASKAMYLVLLLSMPPIIVGSIVGLLFSLFQAITQLQEQTLSFGVKLIAVSLTILATAGWLGGMLLTYGEEIFVNFNQILN
ncbi:type III secretion system export apparatus subunit SctS [Desulfospira joergensenii]|uniref:type III secretion system export apparatus subunit SctS n=1 Tax=Desulfospira joergensenii TaxID=53329 RepID=UPI0003B404AE|nr:type III secretion system export apparatus subunit SctS [Desulfospira joergensenii]